MEAASVSGEYVPMRRMNLEFVRQIGKSIQKLLVVARVSTDRVILLGKRQRADKREKQSGRQGGEGTERGNLQETIFTEFVPEH